MMGRWGCLQCRDVLCCACCMWAALRCTALRSAAMLRCAASRWSRTPAPRCHPAASCHPLPLPSHNFSQAALGLLSMETGSLLIRSYELSVVCFPSLEAACECSTA